MSSTPNPANPADLNKTAVEKLKAAILAKRKADEALALIEQSIAAYEGSYLAETSASGNIIKGFENYLKPTPTQVQRRNQPVIHDEDRLFSGSSMTYETSIQLLQDKADQKQQRLEARQQQIEAQSAGSDAPSKKRDQSSRA